MCCLADAIPYSKEFGFYRSNVYDMVDGFGNDNLFFSNMEYKCNHFVFDAGVSYNNSSVRVYIRVLIDILKMVEIGGFGFGIFITDYVKGKTIRKIIY